MAEVSNSVVHLTMRFGKTVLSIGTGVIYQHQSEYFIVTAWHNLSGRHSETLATLNKNLAIPDNVIVTLAIGMQEYSPIRISITLPLIDEEKSLFYIHKENWPRIDVAVIPFDPHESFNSEMNLSSGEKIEMKISPIMQIHNGNKSQICPIQKYFIPNESVIKEWLNSVEVTEELFIPGYPKNIQDYYAQPVWKRATIASSVQNGWNREPKFLIDSASASGMSGSPVLYYSPNGSVKIHGSTYHFVQDVAILVGIYVGRLSVDTKSDPQVGIVWNQSVIDEIIIGRCHEKLPHEVELSKRELLIHIEDLLKTCSKKGLDNILDPEMPSRHYVKQSLFRKINGRCSPQRAIEAIVEAASEYDGPLVADSD